MAKQTRLQKTFRVPHPGLRLKPTLSEDERIALWCYRILLDHPEVAPMEELCGMPAPRPNAAKAKAPNTAFVNRRVLEHYDVYTIAVSPSYFEAVKEWRAQGPP